MASRTLLRDRLCWTGLTLALLTTVLGLAACRSDQPSTEGTSPFPQRASVPDSMTIPRMLDTDDRFSTLRTALDSTGLDSLLATEGPFTLLAPPNDAFEALPPGTMTVLLSEDQDRLRTILAQHVVEDRLSMETDSMPERILPITGDTLSLDRTQEGFRVGEAAVLDANIEASNGLLHVIDRVLRPPSPEDRP